MHSRNEFYDWAFADLNSNNLRGMVAEFLVCKILGCRNQHRVEWDAVDLIGPDGRAIEVKSSGYVQSWEQKQLSRPRFDIASKRSWFAQSNTYAVEKARSADVYIFCLLAEKEKARLNPLDQSQWQFVVMSKVAICDLFGTQGTISWDRLLKTSGPAVEAGELLARYNDINAV